MNNLKTKGLLFVLITLIFSFLLIYHSRLTDTYRLTPSVESKQVLTNAISNINPETYEPLKIAVQVRPILDSSEKNNSTIANNPENNKTQEQSLKYNMDPTTIKIPILMYHSINAKSTNNLIITPQEFDKQLKWLKDNGFTPLSLDEVYSMLSTGKDVPPKPVALTFDDGYVDNYTQAYPILKKYNFKATIFLITDTIGQPFALKEDQIREMYANNIDFQSHTASHQELSSLTYKKQLDELIRSKETLGKLLNKNIDYICYPVGKYNEDTIKASKVTGYKMGFTTKPGHAKQSNGLYTLTRVRMFPGMGMQGLNSKK